MEDFVPFELAKKLKEKGFTCQYPIAMYNELGSFHALYTSADHNPNIKSVFGNREYYDYDDFDDKDCVCPTISQVLKWLREEKKIYIMVDRSFSVRGWHYYIIDNDDFENPIQQEVEHNRCYEQAAIAGIEYVLDNLIK